MLSESLPSDAWPRSSRATLSLILWRLADIVLVALRRVLRCCC